MIPIISRGSQITTLVRADNGERGLKIKSKTRKIVASFPNSFRNLFFFLADGGFL